MDLSLLLWVLLGTVIFAPFALLPINFWLRWGRNRRMAGGGWKRPALLWRRQLLTFEDSYWVRTIPKGADLSAFRIHDWMVGALWAMLRRLPIVLLVLLAGCGVGSVSVYCGDPITVRQPYMLWVGTLLQRYIPATYGGAAHPLPVNHRQEYDLTGTELENIQLCVSSGALALLPRTVILGRVGGPAPCRVMHCQ